MQPDKTLVTYFLEKIHGYYPIGIPQLLDDYPGYRELKKIQHEKMLAAENDQPENWFRLVAGIKKEWSAYQVTNLVGAPFPCYKLYIELQREEKTGITMRSDLLLVVSLLVPYYCIVLVDDYVYRSGANNMATAGNKFLCSGENHQFLLPDKMTALKLQVEDYFPGYQYAPHDVLFKYKVLGGFSYNGWYENIDKGIIFDFLFSDDFVNCSYTVAH